MDPVKKVEGKALPLGWDDVDTDQIVPSNALKRIERTSFGQFLFSAWREDPDFVLNKPEHEDAVVLIAVELPEASVQKLLEIVRENPEAEISVDLEGRVVKAPGFEEPFAFDNFARYRLLNGLDDIGLTLTHEDELEAFERSRPDYLPSVQ